MTTTAIDVKGLGRRFGDTWVLREIDFEVPQGAFLGVLGRNGVGKTTLVRLLTGQLSLSEGAITMLDMDMAARPLSLRRRMGVMPETLLEALTGLQYLGFVGRLHGLPMETLEARIRELEALLEMDFGAAPISAYSFGMKKKTALAASLLHGPELLFLDEPFEGLDPVSASMLCGLLSDLHRKGVTILLTSHLLGMAERLCDRYLLIDGGRILAQGTASELISEGDDLESLFLRRVGRRHAGSLSWM